jgi:transposase
MRPAGSPAELERRRLRAVELLAQGYPPVEVARMVSVNRRSVRRWKAAFRKKGRLALEARPACGRPPKLPASLTRRLERELLRGAQAAGFATDLWTCPRVARLIEQGFNVHYHVDHIGRLLHSLGWSPQKPTRRAIERDEEGIRRWIKQTRPALKKSPPAERLAGLPG